MKKILFFSLLSLFLYNCKNESPKKSEEKNNKNTNIKVENIKVEKVIDIACELGEGAFWNHKNDELLFIDIEGEKLHSFSPKTKELQTFEMEARIGTVVPTQNPNNLIVALDNGIFEFDKTKNTKTKISDPEPNRPKMRMNDGKCDPAGRFWVGSMHLDQIEGTASLYKIEPNGNHQKMIPNVTISNGIIWSDDEKKMYYIDTPTGKVKEFDYEKTTGKITFVKDAVDVPVSLGYPDGMTIDEEGMLWIALWNGNSVSRWNPKTGELLSKIELPAHNISSCAFGGDDLGTLYVTSARVDMTEEELAAKPNSGAVFAFRPGVKGVKANFFGGVK